MAYFWEAAHFKDQQHTNHIINQREWNLDILKQAGNTIPEIKYTYARRLRPKKHRTNHDLLVEINKLGKFSLLAIDGESISPKRLVKER